jgi:hypothetical protein
LGGFEFRAATTFRVPVRFTEVILIHCSHAVCLLGRGLALSLSNETGLLVVAVCCGMGE